MQDLLSVMSKEEFISFSLRSLYSKYGYTKFRMSKFEGYDLYVQNKDFLVSENVITFTDGKLLALKPDVTLSIVKNSKDVGGLTKVYYNENVYRVSRGANAFKEIMQAGLECIGWVDEKTINEVLLLAGKSLQVISPNNMLVISHLDIIKGVIDYASVSLNAKSEILKLLGEKNLFGIKAVLKKENVNEDKASLIEKLVTVYGTPSNTLSKLDCFMVDEVTTQAVNELKIAVNSLLESGFSNVMIDFSVVNDMKYYNGISFKGFIEGVPTGILSGGEYDNLMKKMGRTSKAIGFAVYLDEVSRI